MFRFAQHDMSVVIMKFCNVIMNFRNVILNFRNVILNEVKDLFEVLFNHFDMCEIGLCQYNFFIGKILYEVFFESIDGSDS